MASSAAKQLLLAYLAVISLETEHGSSVRAVIVVSTSDNCTVVITAETILFLVASNTINISQSVSRFSITLVMGTVLPVATTTINARIGTRCFMMRMIEL